MMSHDLADKATAQATAHNAKASIGAAPEVATAAASGTEDEPDGTLDPA